MQDGFTPAYKASEKGDIEILALMLAIKADINAASNVQQFKIFKYVKLIDNELEDFMFFSYYQRLQHMKTRSFISHGLR
jgi:hypothetical protein